MANGSPAAPAASCGAAAAMLASSRRRVIAAFSLLPGFAVAANVISANALANFVSLSAELTGYPPDSLDRQFASTLLQALIADGADIGTLGPGGDEVAPELATQIISAWYSGVLPTTPTPTVAKFHDALVWRTVDFATPPSVCGQPGAWAEAPTLGQ